MSIAGVELQRGRQSRVRPRQRRAAGACRTAAARSIPSATPCAVEPFPGAGFQFLAANVLTAEGGTLFPGTAIQDFGPVQIGFIGMTLKETATLVTPAGVAGLTFADEAATANAAVPALKAAGADAIVLLIHQGAKTKGGYNDKSCPGLRRRHPADPRQARSGDRPRRLRPHPLGLYLRASRAPAAGRGC